MNTETQLNQAAYVIGTMTAGQARGELRHLTALVEAIDDLFNGGTGRMPAADWPMAQGLLSLLKDRVDGWYRIGGTVRAENAMNQVEELVFFAAIADIRSHLTIRRGSQPNPSWGEALYDVRFDLGYWLPHLDKEGLED